MLVIAYHHCGILVFVFCHCDQRERERERESHCEENKVVL